MPVTLLLSYISMMYNMCAVSAIHISSGYGFLCGSFPAIHKRSIWWIRRYGGVVVRENIAKAADWYVYDFEGLIAAIKPEQPGNN